MAKRQAKQSAPPGGITAPQRDCSEWEALANVGDVRRFLRWTILEVKDGSLDRQTGAVLGQLGCYALKALEASELGARLARLEEIITKRTGTMTGAPSITVPNNAADILV